MLNELKNDLEKLRNPEKAKVYSNFFKTGKGEYGEGDFFLGISVPKQRKIAKKYVDLSLAKIENLLNNKIHEFRLTGVLILIEKYYKADEKDKERIFNFYLKNVKTINNWDLVDLSAPKIVGGFLFDKNKKILYDFAESKNLWKRRIAIVATYGFIRQGEYSETLRISKILLNDSHDLIHKAVGWMLREVGKKNLEVEEKFLKGFYKKMPRTMLRYAIERFEEKKRQKYLRGKI